MLTISNSSKKHFQDVGKKRIRQFSGSRSKSLDSFLSVKIDANSKCSKDSGVSNVDINSGSYSTLKSSSIQSPVDKHSLAYDVYVTDDFANGKSQYFYSLPELRLNKSKPRRENICNQSGIYKYSTSLAAKTGFDISCEVSESGYTSRGTILAKYNPNSCLTASYYPVFKVIDWFKKHTGKNENEDIESLNRSSEDCILGEITDLSQSFEESIQANISEETYWQFQNSVVKSEIPHYFVCMYLDQIEGKIIIRAKSEYVYEALCHLNQNYGDLYSQGAFVIYPCGPLIMAMKSFDVKKDSTSEDTDKWPGANLTKIETGTVMNVLHRFDLENYGKPIDDDGIHFATPFSQGTLGAILEDKNGNIYGLTAKHIFCDIDWPQVKLLKQYEAVINRMKCKEKETSVLSYAKVLSTSDQTNKDFKYYLFTDSCYGIFCPDKDKFADAALLPITPSLQVKPFVNKDFTNNNSKVQLKVYKWSGGMNKSLPIPIQVISAKSGCRKGKIINGKVSAFFNGVYLGCDAFIVESNDGKAFLQGGDSGALITDEINNEEEEDSFAYGIHSFTDGNLSYCTRLESALDYFKCLWGLELQFTQIQEPQSESEKEQCNNSTSQVMCKPSQKENIKYQKESSSDATDQIPVEVYNRQSSNKDNDIGKIKGNSSEGTGDVKLKSSNETSSLSTVSKEDMMSMREENGVSKHEAASLRPETLTEKLIGVSDGKRQTIILPKNKCVDTAIYSQRVQYPERNREIRKFEAKVNSSKSGKSKKTPHKTHNRKISINRIRRNSFVATDVWDQLSEYNCGFASKLTIGYACSQKARKMITCLYSVTK